LAWTFWPWRQQHCLPLQRVSHRHVAIRQQLPKARPRQALSLIKIVTLSSCVASAESVGGPGHTEWVTDDDAAALGAGTRLDWLVNHERKVAAGKAALAQWAQRMEETAPGSAERDLARERLEDAARQLRTHADQLTARRASAAAARRRMELADQRRRPVLVMTVVQAAVVAALAAAGLMVSMPGWGWGIVALGGALCVVQVVIARATDRAGWPPSAAGGTCVLVVLAGLAALGLLPGWAALTAIVVIVVSAFPIVAGVSFDLEDAAGGKQV
jgi:hypothetical protein